MKRNVHYILTLLVQACVSEWNTGNSKDVCTPAWRSVDGQGYCSDKSDGWFDGGSWAIGNINSHCWKNARWCNCPDCGGGNVQCKDWRCDDEVGVMDSEGNCLVQGARQIPKQYDFCYRGFKSCDPCPFGWKREGCMRTSPGTCVQCFGTGIPPAGTFLLSTGTRCETVRCTTATPGNYQVSPCTSTRDAVFNHCSMFPGRDGIPGNPNSIIAGYMGQPYWYCPAGGTPQRLPLNSHPVLDYASFACDDGFYQTDAGLCKLCPPGSACLHGRIFQCPQDYYSRDRGSTSCTLCTVSCAFGDELPIRCPAGSTLDRGCVNCNMCGFTLEYGHQCSENTEAMRHLPATCTPLASSGDVAVCQ